MYSIAKPIKLNNNQAFLLCTDGIWEWITEKQLGELLKSSAGAKKWLDKIVELVELSSRNAMRDNYSAITVFIK